MLATKPRNAHLAASRFAPSSVVANSVTAASSAGISAAFRDWIFLTFARCRFTCLVRSFFDQGAQRRSASRSSFDQCLKVSDFRGNRVEFRVVPLHDPRALGAYPSSDQLASVLDCFCGEQVAPYRLKNDKFCILARKM